MTGPTRGARGFSLIETIFILGITAVIAAIALPMMSTTIGDFRLRGDARSLTNAVSLAKLRAAAAFTNVRLFVDLTGKTYHVESYNRATLTWTVEGGNTSLTGFDTFGFGGAAAAGPPPNSVLAQAPACKTAANADIANTACVLFNSRGIPVDPLGVPFAADALYVTDGAAVYGVTLSATGLLQLWRTNAGAVTWVLQ